MINQSEIFKQPSSIRIPQSLKPKALPKLPPHPNLPPSTPTQTQNPLFSFPSPFSPFPHPTPPPPPSATHPPHRTAIAPPSLNTNYNLRQIEQLCEIISYYLGQYSHPENSLAGGGEDEKGGEGLGVYSEREVEEIRERFESLSLGLFVMKLPNPDNPPEELVKFYEKIDEKVEGEEEGEQENYEEDNEEDDTTTHPQHSRPNPNLKPPAPPPSSSQKYISLHQAINLYNQLFQNELPQNLNMSEKQKTAFIVSFYLLNLPQTPLSSPPTSPHPILPFISTLQFYKLILPLTLSQYQKLRKTHPSIPTYESNLLPSIKRKMHHLFLLDNFINSSEINLQFLNIKHEIISTLKSTLGSFATLAHQLSTPTSFLSHLLQSHPRLDLLFSFFPELLIEILKKIKKHPTFTRLLYNGGHLRKHTLDDGGPPRWVKTSTRPRDTLHLLRNTLTYKLTRRSALFTRSFLSSCTHYIYLIVDCDEPTMQLYSSTTNLPMQIQIGSIDLFSFEPVDKYYRPLRLNRFIRDPEFSRKYNLRNNKSAKDVEDPMKSVESRVGEYYRSAMGWSEDELRIKVVLEVEELERCWRWVGGELGVEYVEGEVLENGGNNEEVRRGEWEVYYVWVKLVLEYHRRIQAVLDRGKRGKGKVGNQSQPPKPQHYSPQIKHHLGLLYRLALLKSLSLSNTLFPLFSPSSTWLTTLSSSLPSLATCLPFLPTAHSLSSLWDRLSLQQPTIYTPYHSRKTLQRIWRKYEINELKERSKFVHSERVYICNKVVNKVVNIAPAKGLRVVEEYFPVHDPYVLKGIRVEPYVGVVAGEEGLGWAVGKEREREREREREKDKEREKQKQQNLYSPKPSPHSHPPRLSPLQPTPSSTQLHNLLKQLESPCTTTDFASSSLSSKLSFSSSSSWSSPAHLSIRSIKDYSGTKLALYFSFSQFFANKLQYMFPLCLILQILLWVQTSDIGATGESPLTLANDILLFLFSLINMVWAIRFVEGWRKEEEKFVQEYGLGGFTESQQTRNMFKGEFIRSMQDDNMNFQYTPLHLRTLKQLYSTLTSLLFLALVISTVLIIFILKGYLIELSYPPSTVSFLPPLLISLSSELYSYLYKILARKLTDFENHKTVSQYQNSLIFKTYLIIFFDNFNSIFLYAFLSFLFPSLSLCEYRVEGGGAGGGVVVNCGMVVGNQMLVSVLVRVAVGLVGGGWVWARWKVEGWRRREQGETKLAGGKNKKGGTMNYHDPPPTTTTPATRNPFESIDQFYQQQSLMPSFMFSPEIDLTFISYTNLIIKITTLILFAPILPFAYCLLYLDALLTLHLEKHKILFLSQRTIPVKTKSIGVWKQILTVISFLGVVVNLGYVIYTRGLEKQMEEGGVGASRVFFGFGAGLMVVKLYLGMFYGERERGGVVLEGRSKERLERVIGRGGGGKGRGYREGVVNTDIRNVQYDEQRMQRELTGLSRANVRTVKKNS